MECPSCKRSSPSDARFCMHCAAPLVAACTECGAELPAGARFCPRCAHAVEEAQAPEPTSEDGAERRQLTVMFCDLVGSTELSERLDAEEYREAVRTFQAMAEEVARELDGTVAQYLGDGLLVYFGHPRAHEDDPVRAVNAALGIQAGLPELSSGLAERLPRFRERPLRARVAIHTGPVVVGEMGAGSRREQLAVGSTLNVVARLDGVGEPGSVVISDATRRLVHGVFVLEELGTRRLKGIDEPVPVHRVVGATGVLGRLELSAGRLTPLVGRDREVALLLDRWERVTEGRGQVVLVSGDPGIGKSRLVQALRERLAPERHHWLECRGSAYHTNSALYPVIDCIERRLAEEGGSEPSVAQLARSLEGSGLPPDEVVPVFADLLSLPLSGRYPGLTGDPEGRRRQTLETLARWVLGLAERRPTVLVLEDLHWVDPSTLELLGSLIEQVPASPLLVLATFRPGFEPRWPSRSHQLHLSLAPLTRAQMLAMVDRVARGRALPAAVLEQLVEKTDGVPLFVEEMTRMVLESEWLAEAESLDGGAELRPELAIPSTLQDSLMARLDRLGAAKEVAQVGAVLGREFPYALLAAVAPGVGDELAESLGRLEAAELMFRQGVPPRSRYAFKHALIQTAAYESLLLSRRRELHAKTARALERDFPDTCERQPELLAHHFGAAGLFEPAIDWCQRAGDRARERSAFLEATAHFERGLEWLRELPETRERSRRELGLQLGLGCALKFTKGFGAPGVEGALLRAAELCREGGEVRELFTVLAGLLGFHNQRPHYQTSLRLADQLLDLAETAREPALLVHAHTMVGEVNANGGMLLAAREHYRAGMELYSPEEHHARSRQLGDGDLGVRCRVHDAWALALLGYPEQAVRRLQEALEFANSLDHPLTLWWCLGFAIYISLTLRDGSAVDRYARGIAAGFERLGVEEPRGPFKVWLEGWAALEEGRTSQGIERMREGIDVMSEEGSLYPLPQTLGILCEAYAAAGRPDEGLALLAARRAELDGLGGWNAAELHRVRGELLRARSADEEAEAAFREALDVARGQSARLLELRAAVSLARLLRARSRDAEARSLLTPIYRWFVEGFGTADLKDAKALIDELP